MVSSPSPARDNKSLGLHLLSSHSLKAIILSNFESPIRMTSSRLLRKGNET
jgi:hypothetical protein